MSAPRRASRKNSNKYAIPYDEGAVRVPASIYKNKQFPGNGLKNFVDKFGTRTTRRDYYGEEKKFKYPSLDDIKELYVKFSTLKTLLRDSGNAMTPTSAFGAGAFDQFVRDAVLQDPYRFRALAAHSPHRSATNLRLWNHIVKTKGEKGRNTTKKGKESLVWYVLRVYPQYFKDLLKLLDQAIERNYLVKAPTQKANEGYAAQIGAGELADFMQELAPCPKSLAAKTEIARYIGFIEKNRPSTAFVKGTVKLLQAQGVIPAPTVGYVDPGFVVPRAEDGRLLPWNEEQKAQLKEARSGEFHYAERPAGTWSGLAHLLVSYCGKPEYLEAINNALIQRAYDIKYNSVGTRVPSFSVKPHGGIHTPQNKAAGGNFLIDKWDGKIAAPRAQTQTQTKVRGQSKKGLTTTKKQSKKNIAFEEDEPVERERAAKKQKTQKTQPLGGARTRSQARV